MASSTVLVVHPGAEMYGSDRVLLNSVIGLIEAGAAVTVLLPGEGPLGTAVKIAGATVVTAPTFVLRKRLMRPSGWWELIHSAWIGAGSAWSAISRYRPDVVYVSTITLPLWPVISRLRRVPVVLHIHEADRSTGRLTEAVLYAPAAWVRRIIVNSRFTQDVMASASSKLRARSVVLLNAVPGPTITTAPREHLDGRLRILYVGRLSPRKGVDLVIDALSILRGNGIDATLDIVGSAFEGYEDYVAALGEMIADADLDEAVTMHGFQEDIWAKLDACDVVVMPSRLDESFGNTAVEAILAARPVVVSDLSGLREATAGISTAWRVRTDSAEAIADALTEIVGCWSDVRGDVESSRVLASDRHAPEQYQKRAAELIMGVAARR